jgi:hypothetical protein
MRFVAAVRVHVGALQKRKVATVDRLNTRLGVQ